HVATGSRELRLVFLVGNDGETHVVEVCCQFALRVDLVFAVKVDAASPELSVVRAPGVDGGIDHIIGTHPVYSREAAVFPIEDSTVEYKSESRFVIQEEVEAGLQVVANVKALVKQWLLQKH